MAMPFTGTLYLFNPNQASNCRSIAHAVYGSMIPIFVSLRDAGIAAGFSGNITHRCFYGYTSSTTILSVSPTSVTFASNGGNETISVTTSGSNSWNASSNQSWATISGGSGTGNGSFTIQVGSWFGSENRTALVTVTSSAPSVGIEVTQLGFA